MHAGGVFAHPFLKLSSRVCVAHLAEADAAVVLWVPLVHLRGDRLPGGLQPLAPGAPGRVEVGHHCAAHHTAYSISFGGMLDASRHVDLAAAHAVAGCGAVGCSANWDTRTDGEFVRGVLEGLVRQGGRPIAVVHHSVRILQPDTVACCDAALTVDIRARLLPCHIANESSPGGLPGAPPSRI